jgi:hypothetical protein
MTTVHCGATIGTWGTNFSLNDQSMDYITDMALWGFTLSVIIGGAIV